MLKKIFCANLTFALLFVPLFSQAESVNNAGFLQGNIWYSKDPFFAGDTIRIYSAVFNSSSEDISGSIEFYDNDSPIGKSGFLAEKGGELTKVWVDWQATEGEHAIVSKITEANKILPNGEKVAVELQNVRSQQSTRFADLDTDKDGVGNLDDADDDNDGFDDENEALYGTDPEVPTTEEQFAIAFENSTSTSSANLAKEGPYNTLQNIDGGVETILSGPVGLLEKEKERVKGNIQNKSAGHPADSEKKAYSLSQYAYLAFLSAASFALQTKVIIYALALFVIYKFVKFLVRCYVFRR